MSSVAAFTAFSDCTEPPLANRGEVGWLVASVESLTDFMADFSSSSGARVLNRLAIYF